MAFIEPVDERILVSSIDVTKAPFIHFPASFLNWLCTCVENTQNITSDISREALNETIALLHSECQSLEKIQKRIHSGHETIPLQQYVSLVGLGPLLPQDSEALTTERLKYDWRKEFSGKNGMLLLELLIAGESLFFWERSDMAAVFTATIEFIRSIPLEKRLDLYRRSERGLPLHWIPRIEQLPRLPETKASHFIRAHEVEPCIVDGILSDSKPSQECLGSIKKNSIASDVALLILADTNPGDLERLHLLEPHLNQLIALFMRLSSFSGDASAVISELNQTTNAHPAVPAANSYRYPDGYEDVRPTILGWIKTIAEEMSDDTRATWILGQTTLPTEVIDLLSDLYDTKTVRNRIMEAATAILASPEDRPNRTILPREFFSRLMYSILDNPATEDLPILCCGISNGLLQQELYFDSSLLDGVRKKARIDSEFRKALPSLGVGEWPDQSDKSFWRDILEKNGLGPPSAKPDPSQEKITSVVDEDDLGYWLSTYPNNRAIATYRFMENWSLARLRTRQGDDAIRRILGSSEYDDAIKICILADLIQKDFSIISAFSDKTEHLNSVARQILNNIRLGFQNDAPDKGQDLDLCVPAVIVTGQMDSWWKALKHIILIMRHLKEPVLGPDLKPSRTVDRELQEIPKAFEFTVYRIMTNEDLEVLRREMAVGLVEYLKPRRTGQNERTGAGLNSPRHGYDPNLKEPDPIWREAYLRALKDLGVKQRAPGKTFHGVLQKIAQLDPSEKVRTAAIDSDRALNSLRSAWASGSHKRLISHAWWWIKQAHLISRNVEINQKEANRTRITEFR